MKLLEIKKVTDGETGAPAVGFGTANNDIGKPPC